LKFEFCDFRELFEICKKASRGPSADDLDHYGRGKLDQSRVLVTKFRQNRLALNGRSAYIFIMCFLLFSSFFLSFSSRILRHRRLDVYHTSTHVALVRI